MTAANDSLIHSRITGDIIGAAMEVHGVLGAGFLESVYEEALCYEFNLREIQHERQKTINVVYKDKVLKQFVCDFLVDGKIIVELKAIKELSEIEKIQVINYLKASGYQVGLLFNFGVSPSNIKG